MVAQIPKPKSAPIIYPESDGLPMADNTLQFRWIMTFYYNLEWLFADNPDIFVAGNLLWYPVEGEVKIRQAPDVMVAFGAGKGDRGSYQQWNENNIAPQVVFEILSPGNTQTEMHKKLLFYARYGVEEYYIYDPQRNDLSGLLRPPASEVEALPLQAIEEMQGWVSPRLKIRFELADDELQLYRPDGERFSTYLEVQRRLEAEKERAEQAEGRAQQAEERAQQAEERAQQAEGRAEQAEERAQQAAAQLAEERRKAEMLAERLRQMGIDLDRA
ncbi:Uma2 family endonuclease [Oscillatoria sp. FACHB-1406]|uniref:Uma2 family endonuclease n=1 Tax=Oscillatoria sp. FACHB-1406 TaxID=2692846 RepID=UPI001685C372|nr:Uma2 family endonuclease [Oscillatoria sp. FACHB-1406]MBD2576627.1 Uma2 family endonuclease [Oscillatoria sp. FACHB-1406]